MTNSMSETKKLSREEFRNIVVEHMTLQWLKQNDLDPSDPKTPAIEIDENEETSQLVAWKLTAEEAYDYMLEALEKIDDMGYEIEDEEDEEEEAENIFRDFREDSLDNRTVPLHTPQETKPSKSRLTKTNTTFLFLDTPPGQPFYVSDVREWLAEAERLASDGTEVEGSLFVSIDTDIETSERSECLYCGNKEDILLTVHDCRGGDEDV